MSSSKDLARRKILSFFKKIDAREGHAIPDGTLLGWTNELDASHINEAVAELVREGLIEEKKLSGGNGIVLTQKGYIHINR